VQRFNPTAARTGATLMTLAVVALLIPALFAHLVPPHHIGVTDISLEISLLLLLAYALSLVFSLRTHRRFYAGGVNDSSLEDHARSDPRRAGAALLCSTVMVAVLAEFMVGTVESVAHSAGLTELFIGVVVVAIVGNAAEHSTAVLMAVRNRMDLSLSIAIGSSIQIALLVAPLLVFLSALLGTPMDLVFTLPEIVAVAVAVGIVGQIAGDGESHWLEGALLLIVYGMLALFFYHLPG